MLLGVIDRARSSAKSMVLIYGWALTPIGLGHVLRYVLNYLVRLLQALEISIG